jgi:Fur family transcriptional regulator, ferric uptake regulator
MEQTEKQIFSDFIARKGLRSTSQRELILDEFLRQTKHISAEELYDLVKMRDKTIGQATVYRVLKLLSESGIAREVNFGDGLMRYEREFGHEHHDHLVCTSCGKMLEVVDPAIETLQKALAEKYGFTLSDHEMYLYGICEDCRSK